MPRRRKGTHDKNSDVQDEDQPSQEQKRQMLQRKTELFIQQFEKEAEARLNELGSKLQNLVATINRAFDVLPMQTPQSVSNTLLKDAIADGPVGDVTIALETQSPEIRKPLSRKPSKKGKMSEPPQNTPKRATSGRGRRGKTRSLEANGRQTLRCATTVGSKRTLPRIAKPGDQSCTVPIARPVSKSFGLGSLRLVSDSAVVVKTSLGETLLIENKEDLELAKVDDVAAHNIKRIRDLMTHFCDAMDM
ncbi:hypothetical protein ACEWY4_013387 [Coilia grayii]|uniref:Borealin N-terminal domain-containing protein n=1 Tax=Coilia grayii TaxID=363190 RepID=A0ABD1JWB0_9TELE